MPSQQWAEPILILRIDIANGNMNSGVRDPATRPGLACVGCKWKKSYQKNNEFHIYLLFCSFSDLRHQPNLRRESRTSHLQMNRIKLRRLKCPCVGLKNPPIARGSCQ